MTYEEYASAMNIHADQCEQCAFSRKTGMTHGVCAEAQTIITEWKASKKTEDDHFYATLNMLARMLEPDEEQDEPKD